MLLGRIIEHIKAQNWTTVALDIDYTLGAYKSEISKIQRRSAISVPLYLRRIALPHSDDLFDKYVQQRHARPLGGIDADPSASRVGRACNKRAHRLRRRPLHSYRLGKYAQQQHGRPPGGIGVVTTSFTQPIAVLMVIIPTWQRTVHDLRTKCPKVCGRT